MTIEFKLPELGENIASGDIVKVLVHEGEQVEPNQGVFELETDKAVIEVPCSEAGTIQKIHVAEGQKVNVGQVLLTLDAPERSDDQDKEESNGTEESSSQESQETSPPVQAEQPATPPAKATEPATTVHEADSIPAGPVARRRARELNVDLTRVAGSGSHGRITPEDVERAATATAGVAAKGSTTESGKTVAAVESREPVVPPGRPDQDAWGPVRRDRLSQIRRTIAQHMAHSASTIPHVTNFDDADVTELDVIRKSVPPGWLAPGIKLTMMPLVLKAVAIGLQQHPMLNASLDEENEEIVYKQYVNLGVAVDTPRGLVVPVLRNVDQMNVGQIAAAVAQLAQQARDAQFAIEDLRGGTFTISNLGAVGGAYSTPIVNHPEVAILLLGRSRWMPIVRDGQVQNRLMMPLSLSYDHRLIDGGMAGRFLNQVIDLLQSPGKLLL